MFRADVIDGRACLLIPGSNGVDRPYACEPFPRQGTPWLVLLYPLGPPRDPYEVREIKGAWSCTCRAWQFSRAKTRACKHTVAVRQLVEWLRCLRAGLPVGDCEGR